MLLAHTLTAVSRVWDMTAKWNGMSNQQMDVVIIQFYFELLLTWMSEGRYTTADNALELMVFDPTKTRVKSTVLHQLSDGNWFVSNADQQLVKSWTTTTCATASPTWWREFCLEYGVKLRMDFPWRKWWYRWQSAGLVEESTCGLIFRGALHSLKMWE